MQDFLPCARRLLCAWFLFLLVLASVRGESTNFVSALERAHALRLWDDPYWETLLHVHKGWFGSRVSRIDDPGFFLAPRGKSDPQAELEATLQAFFLPPVDGAERSVVCRFPARLLWLKDQLNIPDSALPVPDCTDYRNASAHLNVRSITVVYPAAYMNSPASMFGHLLLALDSDKRSRLLSKGVNYAAQTDASVGPLFALKGLFGLYKGSYAILPYYEKVEEYSAVNKRDIWEYELALTDKELDRALRHIWELQNIWSRYYFLTENCASNLLYPLQAAKPEGGTYRMPGIHAIPAAVLKDVVTQTEIRERTYRPSQTRTIHALADRLPIEKQKLALDVARGHTEFFLEDHVPAGVRQDTLRLALALAQRMYTDGECSPDVYRARVVPLMKLRAQLGKGVELIIPEPAPPESGHGPLRMRLRPGWGTWNGRYLETGVRLAYHDWMDATRGFEPGAYISFADMDVRWWPEGDSLEIERVSLLNVESYSARNLLEQPVSWSVRLGMDRVPARMGRHEIGVDLAGGGTWQVMAGRHFLMGANRFGVDAESTDHAVWETGLRAGGKWNWCSHQIGWRHRSLNRVAGDQRWRHETSLFYACAYGQEQNGGFEFSRRQQGRESVEEVSVFWTWTF